MAAYNFNIKGLTTERVLSAREKYGCNTLDFKKENGFTDAIKRLLKEPMVLLLLVASSIYFISGSVGDALFLAAAIVLVSAISLYQDSRSRNALKQLEDFIQPACTVIRNGKTEEIKSADLVVGDCLVIEEGMTIPADGTIIHSNDFSVNEAMLTGESLPVYKDKDATDNQVYSGTTVTGGLAVVVITVTGNQTRLGKIGTSLEEIQEEQTPLESQINNFVKKMVVAGTIVFIIVWAINYSHSRNLLDSLLKALTLAMSILPEEIPVAFTTFMALGAWRLMKMGIVVKQMKTVETLGSATVICIDKTGTITENRMSLARLYVLATDKLYTPGDEWTEDEKDLLRTAMWASEPAPFDPMETALHDAYKKTAPTDERPRYKMIHEYVLGGTPPMMTHVFQQEHSGNRIIAAKGAPEALINVSDLTAAERQRVENMVTMLATEGYRVLGVGESGFTGHSFPDTQQELHFRFKGIIAFYDPPRKNIAAVFKDFYRAGIAVKIITGDNAATTTAIARQTGFYGYEKSLSGEELMKLPYAALERTIPNTNVFTRMFPDAKLKIINILKSRHEIVAMTGDGVNDAPALKAAHIGIAMGKKGTEIARQAASLILLEDDLSGMVAAVAVGRRIYSNLKKAIRYIISIHIPIILTVFIPLAAGWLYPNIFSPVHIIFMELVMGPTCSIIYENEPIEKNAMEQPPRPSTQTFLNMRELITSIIQGLAVTAASLAVYRYGVYNGLGESTVRTMVFTVLIAANISLTFANRSFYYSLFTTMKYRNNLVLLITGLTITLTALLLFVPPLTRFFRFEMLSLHQLLVSTGAGVLSVAWYEIVKWIKRSRNTHK